MANKVCKVCQGYNAQVGWHGRAVGMEKGRISDSVPFYSLFSMANERGQQSVQSVHCTSWLARQSSRRGKGRISDSVPF